MNRTQEKQTLIRRYREETGKDSFDMHEIAAYANQMGWPLPQPKSGLDILAAQFSKAARQETRVDGATGKPYRAYLAVTTWTGGDQMTLWSDIDLAPRSFAHKAFQQRREHMVGEAVQLTFDMMHWNRANPDDEPIDMPMDFEEDVQWRLNEPDQDEEAA